MQPPLMKVLERVFSGADPTEAEVYAAFGAVLDGACDPVEIGALLTGLRCRGESVPVLVGAARVMRERVTTIPCQSRGLLDTCGPGGDGSQTFNISTAAALVAAAAGAVVAKHGNRSATSRTGSADVLEALGVNLALTPEQVGRCIDEVGIGFCFAPTLHTAMKYAGPVRKQLGFRTVFNLLGPLTNPARAEFQLIGVGRLSLARLVAEALRQLGAARAIVVCGNDQIDEVCLWGTTTALIVSPSEIREEHWTAASLGLAECQLSDLYAADVPASAATIKAVLAGVAGPARDVVIANAAAGLWAGNRVASLKDGVAAATKAIDSGAAAATLTHLVEASRAVS